METTFTLDSKKPMPVALTAVGFLADSWVAMVVESIGGNELFFSSSEYVQPQEVFQMLIWLPHSQTPLYVEVTASSVKQTLAGFRVAAQVSSISTNTQALLDRFYLKAVASQPRQARCTMQLLKRRVVKMLERALHGPALAMVQHRKLHLDGHAVSNV